MFRSPLRIVVLLCLFLPCARAKVAVKDSQFGFSYELPVGFKEADKNVPGHHAADVVQSHAGPAFRGQPPNAVIVERLHAPLAQPAGAPAQEGAVGWKTFRLPVERKDGRENGEAVLTFQVSVPLAREAMRISVSGPAAQEKRVRNALEIVLSSLDGPTDWKPVATPSAAPKPADAKPQTAQAARPKPPAPAAQPQAKKPETKSRDWAFWVAITVGGILAALRIYFYVRKVIGISKPARYGVLAAFCATCATGFIVHADPVATPVNLALLGVLAAGTVFALWRIKMLAKEPGATDAPLAVEPNNRLLAELANKSDLQIRLLGLLYLGVVGMAMNWCIFEPLHKAETEHPEHLRYYETPLIILPLAAALGLMAVILGKDLVRMSQRMAEQRRATGKKVSTGGLIYFIALFAAGFVLLVWFHAKLRALGYKA